MPYSIITIFNSRENSHFYKFTAQESINQQAMGLNESILFHA